jgi:hypothetical protein
MLQRSILDIFRPPKRRVHRKNLPNNQAFAYSTTIAEDAAMQHDVL